MQATMVVVWHGSNDQYHTIAFGTFGATISTEAAGATVCPREKLWWWYQGDHVNHHHILRAAFYYLFWVSQVI